MKNQRFIIMLFTQLLLMHTTLFAYNKNEDDESLAPSSTKKLNIPEINKNVIIPDGYLNQGKQEDIPPQSKDPVQGECDLTGFLCIKTPKK